MISLRETSWSTDFTFSLEKFCLAVHLFVELVKKFLTLYGVSFFLSDKLNHDPLEEHFGRQRICGGASDNPTLEQYAQYEKKILVAKSESVHVMRGNTRGRQGDGKKIDIHNNTPFPKWKKKEP